MNTQTLDLDVSKATRNYQRVTLGQGDHNGTILVASLYDGGEDLEVGERSVYLNILLPDKVHMYRQRCADPSGNTVAVTVDEEKAASVVGVTKDAYFTVEDDGEVIASTERFTVEVLRSALTAKQAEGWSSDISELIEKAQESGAEIEELLETSREAIHELDGAAEAEEERKTAEAARKAAETARASDETLRSSAEGARADAEALRALAESARAAAEEDRVAAESDRNDAQEQNDLDQARNNADQALNNQSATGAVFHVCTSGEYDPDTLTPTIASPTPSVFYLVPTGEPSDPHLEWLWNGSAFEQVGTNAGVLDPVTTDQIDAVVDEERTSPQGNSVLNLTGLSYLWAAAKSWALSVFSLLGHTHSVSDVSGAEPFYATEDASTFTPPITPCVILDTTTNALYWEDGE